MQLAVVGLGRLGAPLAAVLANRGHDVVGLDTNQSLVDAVNRGEAPVHEPKLETFIKEAGLRLRASTVPEEAVGPADVTFLLVPTPSKPDGSFTLDYLLSAVTAIGPVIAAKPGYHVVVVTSTVMPGSTDGPIRAALENASGLAVGAEVGLCYSPEFIALGSVIDDLLSPDFVLLGESDERAGSVVESVHNSVCLNHAPVIRMSPVNAEIAKIAVNTFVTTKISFANMVAEVCDRLPGADVDVVTAAIGHDSRIGGKYLRGATAYGGPCFPRDNRAFARMAELLGARSDLSDATDQINRHQPERLAELVMSRLPAGGAVAVLGLSYKPDTDVVEASAGVELATLLCEHQIPVTVYDPVGMAAAAKILPDQVSFAETAEQCVAAGDAVVIATSWPEFAAIPAAAFAKPGRRRTIIDCWRLLSRAELADVADVIYLGSG